MSKKTYEALKGELGKLRDAGRFNGSLTREERADWAYGNTKVENDSVTREMAERAVAKKSGRVVTEKANSKKR